MQKLDDMYWAEKHSVKAKRHERHRTVRNYTLCLDGRPVFLPICLIFKLIDRFDQFQNKFWQNCRVQKLVSRSAYLTQGSFLHQNDRRMLKKQNHL